MINLMSAWRETYKKGQRGAIGKIDEDKGACCRTGWMGEMLQVSAHEAHSRHSLPSLSLHHGNIHHTLFTPLYEAGKHGNQRGKVYVCVCVCVLKKGWGVQICSCCQLSNKDLHKPQKKSWLPSLGWVLGNSLASVGTVLPCRPSLGLAVEATRVSIIVAAPNPVKTH